MAPDARRDHPAGGQRAGQVPVALVDECELVEVAGDGVVRLAVELHVQRPVRNFAPPPHDSPIRFANPGASFRPSTAQWMYTTPPPRSRNASTSASITAHPSPRCWWCLGVSPAGSRRVLRWEKLSPYPMIGCPP